jgi:hypothetical protein
MSPPGKHEQWQLTAEAAETDPYPDGISLSHGAMPQTRQLRKDEPHPVGLLASADIRGIGSRHALCGAQPALMGRGSSAQKVSRDGSRQRRDGRRQSRTQRLPCGQHHRGNDNEAPPGRSSVSGWHSVAASRLNASNADTWRGARHGSKGIARLDVRCALVASGIASKWPLAH